MRNRNDGLSGGVDASFNAGGYDADPDKKARRGQQAMTYGGMLLIGTWMMMMRS
jgi:hypothetical protein